MLHLSSYTLHFVVENLHPKPLNRSSKYLNPRPHSLSPKNLKKTLNPNYNPDPKPFTLNHESETLNP